MNFFTSVFQGGWRHASQQSPSAENAHKIASFMGLHSAWKDVIDNPVLQDKIIYGYKTYANNNIPNAAQVYVPWVRGPE